METRRLGGGFGGPEGDVLLVPELSKVLVGRTWRER